MNLVKLAQNSRISDGEVVELLKIANGNLSRARLEYDRVKAELNTWKAELSNTVRIYQGFCDRNLELKKREDELQLYFNELEGKVAELQKTRFNESLSELQDNEVDNSNLNSYIKQEDILSTNDISLPAISYHQNEDETPQYPFQVESTSRTLICDTKDLL